jgi:AhpD family alkylhydroperoxidase
MTQRLDFYNANPNAIKALLGLEKRISESSLEKSLVELIRLRASLINGCAYCIDLHTADARKGGRGRSPPCHAVRLARNTLLHRSRTRGAGLDRSRHARISGSCAR